jgi:hypothetical protein
VISLPDAAADGQSIQFDNYSAPITALSFRPPVVGWANGAMAGANVGIRIRWDGVDNAWHREE